MSLDQIDKRMDRIEKAVGDNGKKLDSLKDFIIEQIWGISKTVTDHQVKVAEENATKDELKEWLAEKASKKTEDNQARLRRSVLLAVVMAGVALILKT